MVSSPTVTETLKAFCTLNDNVIRKCPGNYERIAEIYENGQKPPPRIGDRHQNVCLRSRLCQKAILMK